MQNKFVVTRLKIVNEILALQDPILIVWTVSYLSLELALEVVDMITENTQVLDLPVAHLYVHNHCHFEYPIVLQYHHFANLRVL